MENQKFSIRQRIRSFGYAFEGIRVLLKEEHNARIHLVAAILSIILAYILELNTMEWIWVLLCICLVFMAEIINSSIENLANLVEPNPNPIIKKVKDLGAAFVLIAALFSLVAGILIFGPKIVQLIG